jgi:CheY-like chemotaxis protein
VCASAKRAEPAPNPDLHGLGPLDAKHRLGGDFQALTNHSGKRLYKENKARAGLEESRFFQLGIFVYNDPMKTILVADDEPNIRRLIQVNLERAGYRVETIENGQQAWERLQQGGIDLLVTTSLVASMVRGELNGFELKDAVRASDEPLASLPVLFLVWPANDRPIAQLPLPPAGWEDGFIFRPLPWTIGVFVDQLLAVIGRCFEEASDTIQ